MDDIRMHDFLRFIYFNAGLSVHVCKLNHYCVLLEPCHQLIDVPIGLLMTNSSVCRSYTAVVSRPLILLPIISTRIS